MDKKYLTFVGLLVLLGGLLLAGLVLRQKQLAQKNNPTALQQQEKEVQGVAVLATPSVTGDEVVIDISMQTHSVELDEDLLQIAELQDQGGKVYKPVAWEGAPAGGHHRAGLLKFKLDSKPKSLTLTLRQFKGEDLKFNWDIK